MEFGFCTIADSQARSAADHIVSGPAGVFVVDAKLYTGMIQVRDVGGLFKRDERLFVGPTRVLA